MNTPIGSLGRDKMRLIWFIPNLKRKVGMLQQTQHQKNEQVLLQVPSVRDTW